MKQREQFEAINESRIQKRESANVSDALILSNGFDMKDLIPKNIDLEKKPTVGRLVADEKRESMSPNRFSNVQMTSVNEQSLTKTIKVSKDGF